ncbi:MAG: glycoside hydrolase family 15 protein [Methanomassiliicoccus sp.]|nr:glycoside hydrolase family 15 protein [Methanomassiliicoccus sp.]
MANSDPLSLAGPGHYKPISDYAAIGDLRSLALVSKDGSIDWCCFPHFGGGSVFAALLDSRKGGRFKVSPRGSSSCQQGYIDSTNVLQTSFTTPSGRMTMIDLMPLSGDLEAYTDGSPHQILRLLSCQEGDVEIDVEWSPRFDYARREVRMERCPEGWTATAGSERMTLSGLDDGVVVDDHGPVLRGRLRLREGERAVLATRWDMMEHQVASDAASRCERCDHALSWNEANAMTAATVEAWRSWVERCPVGRMEGWAGQWLPYMVRSELVLKLLTYAKTGAIIAAPTTSLPEKMGGVRNWDYRFAWIRDASLTAQALISMGHRGEAFDFLCWMERISRAWGEGNNGIHIMFGVLGEGELEEFELDHLEGYRGSRPVRVGNGAYTQIQLEGLGELLNIACELVSRGVRLGTELQKFLIAVADLACHAWKWPDQGIWEIRGEPKHYVYTKAMIWMALDKAVRLHRLCGWQNDVSAWVSVREDVKDEVLRLGYDRDLGSFVQSYGSKELDAANLRLPLMGFLPHDDHRVQGTIDRTLEKLTENGMVYRYLNDDGFPAGEGAFGLCTFWLVDALTLSGRVEEARAVFEGMIRHANHVGLFSEQYDPATGEALGNFPQAFTHVGLINSAINLATAEGWNVPGLAPVAVSPPKAEVISPPA